MQSDLASKNSLGVLQASRKVPDARLPDFGHAGVFRLSTPIFGCQIGILFQGQSFLYMTAWRGHTVVCQSQECLIPVISRPVTGVRNSRSSHVWAGSNTDGEAGN